MRLVYKCSHCSVARDFPIDPAVPMTVEFILENLDGESQVFREHSIRKWIRHPCDTGVHGIAHLVAVLEN